MAHIERRKPEAQSSSPLPSDYLSMVSEVFTSNFDEGLKRIGKLAKEPVRFDAAGAVFPEEIVLCVTLILSKSLSATSVYASADFDPIASSPTIQDLLSLCVDAIGSIFQPLMTAKKDEALENLIGTSLSALENVPFEWTAMTVEKRQIYVKIDKANPKLDGMADEWLRKNDPELAELEAENAAETEKLFVGGPGKKPGSGQVH